MALGQNTNSYNLGKYFRFSTLQLYNKSQKGLPLEIKNTQYHENRRLGSTESLHMQHCSLQTPSSAGLNRIRFSK